MRSPGEIERRTQTRVVRRLQSDLGYRYLGNWESRAENRNVERDSLLKYLTGAGGYDTDVAGRAVRELERAAAASIRRLYDRNRGVYGCCDTA